VVAQSREGLKRLAKAIDEWRDQQGLERWEDVAALHGPSMATLRVIRSGTAGEITRLTRMRIARITGWSREYVDQLLNDEDPVRPETAGEIAPFEAAFEAEIMARDLPADKKQWAIDRYNEAIGPIMAELGIQFPRRRSGHGG
jgi:hypothetical protein